MVHANAPLSATGRLRLARCVVDDGWPLRRAADRFGVSVTTAHRWAARYRQHGAAGMCDRPSRPQSCPHRTSRRRERRVLGLRVSRRWGPARIAYHLGMNPATVHRILTRYRCLRLSWTDPATGAPVRAGRRKVVRYERDAPGDLVHVDIKKLGRIPDGGGHRVHGRAAGKANSRATSSSGRGYAYLHHAVDDHSRYAYSEILADEKKETATAFMQRAVAHFAQVGITTDRVMTDNGSCYRSHLFRNMLQDHGITHKRTRPYTPKTNGKVERFNRTLTEEWAYARPYTSETERAAAYEDFLHIYNHHRAHTALKGGSPADRVPNLAGHYI
ncbi:transposase IS481 family protein [Branchiibius hedensis]|uniref:Leucine-zipper of insertion element IS481 n=1 Tax=Branchiibius hedensis TaxID=672460 RepID=A0A2Y8ZMM7_9MICO|nr:IS481 family transposase [Branchiibius hedensis]PWJ24855.1 transposase IS481 family protein [Branchiibius hedensis]SSA33671.1 leucine-zipper of insertion element IS481 [Branchiibius hedensis]